MSESAGVRMWEADVEIPTYGIGKPDPNPMFLEKRVYQGSTGKVYPHPVIARIADDKQPQAYRIVTLENEYVRIEIMPGLGGRVYRALDLTNNYDFVYYNRVIKPALVGLAGPWISGGIEFNWPQHHRPNTFGPVEYALKENADGSKTVWISEIDRMYGTKVTAGFTLYPGKAYLEISAQLYNRTPQPQTFLWWANPAVAVNEHTQSVFPPDVHAVFDHGKRDVSRFPVATGSYYKMDYSAGVDISRYKNIPVPTSYMAYRSDYNFVGGYDHGVGAGILHVANHHVSPGKKQWTWGNGDFGQAWDRHLTDEDGPYIELMTGVYTDNQPDFTWLEPYEEKSFKQYFMPYKDIGVVKNATIEAAVNLEWREGNAEVRVYATSSYPQARITLNGPDGLAASFVDDLSPTRTFGASVPLPAGVEAHRLELRVLAADGRPLIAYRPGKPAIEPLPDAAKAIGAPEELRNPEALYLAGLHLEQYRHATYEPDAYYLEGLKRDPGDIRLNNAYGLLLLRRGLLTESEPYFRRAVATSTRHNPNPYDSEPYYNLGLTLQLQGRYDEAFGAYYKAVWSAAWQDKGYFALAQIALLQGRPDEALELAERSLSRNVRNYRARNLKTAALRLTDRFAEAERCAAETIGLDIADFGARRELALLRGLQGDDAGAEQAGSELEALLRGDPHNFLALARDYADCGLYAEATDVLLRFVRAAEATGVLPGPVRTEEATKVPLDPVRVAEATDVPLEPVRAAEATSASASTAAAVYPMIFYELGLYAERCGDGASAAAYRASGRAAAPDYCFPNQLADSAALRAAIAADAHDARALYYLGNFLYDKKRHGEAMEAWRRSMALDPAFPTVRRNLALATCNKLGDAAGARELLESAFALNPSDARVFYELDQLYKKLGLSTAFRLAAIERHPELVARRDDLYIEYVGLTNAAGNHEDALALLARRKFHPWEGGEGKVAAQYVFGLVELAKRRLAEGLHAQAAELLLRATVYPDNLGEGKLAGAKENHIRYYLAQAYEGLGEPEKARLAYEAGSQGEDEPTGAMFYNDRPPEMIFYQGLCNAGLGRTAEANGKFNKLVDYGEKQLFNELKIDYFAVSLPDFLVFDDDLQLRNRIHCHFMIGLGYLGLKRTAQAEEQFAKVLELDANHTGAAIHLRLCREPAV